MESTRVLESKLENKDLFLDIIRQVQLPAVQVRVWTREQEENTGRQDVPGADTVATPAKLQEKSIPMQTIKQEPWPHLFTMFYMIR